MADQYEYQTSVMDQDVQQRFKNKHTVRIPDTNAGSYPSSQINWNLSSLTKNNYFLSCKQSKLEIPMVIHVNSDVGMGDAAKTAYMIALKKSACDSVNAISVQLNENSLINFTDLSNLATEFKILATWSEDDVKVMGDEIGFAKNDASSYAYKAAASANGIGECNNTITPVTFNPQSGYDQGLNENKGFAKRARKTSYNNANVENAKYVTDAQLQLKQQSYVDHTSTTNIYYHVLLSIPLTGLPCGDLFEKLPLIRNPYFKITVQMHTSTTVLAYTHTGTTVGLTSVASQYGYNPIMVSKHADGYLTAADAVITIKSGIGKAPNGTVSPWGATCYLNACLYEFNPEAEAKYISDVGTKLVKYNDIYSNTALGQSGTINWQIHSGLANVRGLLIVTRLASTVNTLASPATAQGAGTSTLLSPFTSGENMLGCSWSNMNVKIGNIPHYQNNINYTYDIFQKELMSSFSVNGGLSPGVNSGLITQNDFESGVFNYVWIDLSKKEKNTDDIPKTINFTGTNNSMASALDLYAYVYHENSLGVNLNSSQLTR